MSLPVHGGPWDGLEASARGGFIRYLDSHGRAHEQPAKGRAPYRRLSTKWEYASKYRTCKGCGAIVHCIEPGVVCMCGERP